MVCIDITFPIESKEDILQKYREVFDEHPNIRVAVIGMQYTLSHQSIISRLDNTNIWRVVMRTKKIK